MRVLIAYEESYRAYSGAVELVIRELRPQVALSNVYLRALEHELERFDPHLVVCSRPNDVDPGGRSAWFELSPEPEEASEVCLAGGRSEIDNPDLEALITIIDETEELVQTGNIPGGC